MGLFDCVLPHPRSQPFIMLLEGPRIGAGIIYSPFFANTDEFSNAMHKSQVLSTFAGSANSALLGLAKTCFKMWISEMRISFWDYLSARLAVPGCQAIPPLPHLPNWSNMG